MPFHAVHAEGDAFIKNGLVTLKQIHISAATAQKAANFLLNPISIKS
ncbi:hypothetical protein [[Phormidium ambiguum] IAM M-71]|nr:hypothetical protein [Phormidium ambiguum]